MITLASIVGQIVNFWPSNQPVSQHLPKPGLSAVDTPEKAIPVLAFRLLHSFDQATGLQHCSQWRFSRLSYTTARKGGRGARCLLLALAAIYLLLEP
jgi:hypothetical protein